MIRFFIKVFIGVLIFGILIWKFGPSEILNSISRFKIVALIIINITTLCGYLLAGIGVILLGKAVSKRLEWWQAMKGVLATISLAIFVPGRAGDFSLPFYWKRYMSVRECIAVVLLDKTITAFWVLMLGGCGIYIIFGSYKGLLALSLLLLPVFFLLFSVFVLRSSVAASKILPKKVFEFWEGSVDAIRTMAKSGKKYVILTFFLTGIRIVIGGVGFWVSLWGVDLVAPFFYSIFVTALAQFTTFVPVSIIGIGIFEAVCVFALAQIGIEPSPVMAALVAGRITTMVWLCLFFLLFNVNRGVDRISEHKHLQKGHQ